MRSITIHLLKPGKGTTITFTGELLDSAPGYALVLAPWERPAIDLGYVVFEPDDRFYEHFYADRWYTIFEVRAADERLKGWYCNVTRPALIAADTICSEDLELDLFVAPDRRRILRLDLDEFAARDFASAEPATHAAALAALAELEALARAGAPPFDKQH